MDSKRRGVLAGAVALAAAGLGVRALAGERVVKVVARKFVFLPNEIALEVGVPVVFELTSPDIVMGFHAPELNLRQPIIPGETARVRFTPDRKGTFPFLCDIFCGEGHEGMSGKIVVS